MSIRMNDPGSRSRAAEVLERQFLVDVEAEMRELQRDVRLQLLGGDAVR